MLALGAAAAPAQTLTLSEIRIRDPYVLADEKTRTYYMYAQMGNRAGANSRQRGVEVYTSKDLERWSGPEPVFVVPDNFWARRMVWAPEVHAYRGKFYLFVTFTGEEDWGRRESGPAMAPRGSQILVAESPKGPFRPFHNGPHTPPDWMSLDGTLWVEDGVPWMIFCHEWVQVGDGTMELVRLEPNLSGVAGEPETLFRASEAAWVRNLSDAGGEHSGYVTDGPFLYRTKAGKLLMIWSSFGEEEYAVGLAVSQTGKVQGPWEQVREPLFRANGGHGMIFRTFDGRLTLVLHQPNSSPDERARFFRLRDTGGALELAE